MFEFGAKSNLGTGISALAGSGENNRTTESTSYNQDYSAVFEYNKLM